MYIILNKKCVGDRREDAAILGIKGWHGWLHVQDLVFADIAKEESDNPFILQKVFHLIHKNVSSLAGDISRLICRTLKILIFFWGLQILQNKKMTINQFVLPNVFTKCLLLVHKNVSRLASEVGRLIYRTQRHSSGVCRYFWGENGNPFTLQNVFT